MTNTGNGVDASPIADWVIASTNDKLLIGKPKWNLGVPARIVGLGPVLELQINIVQTPLRDPQGNLMPLKDPQGNLVPGPDGRPQAIVQTQVVHTTVPVMFLSSLRSVELPEGALIVPVAELSREDRNRLLMAVKQGEAIQQNMRSADTGVALVSALPPGLKPPGQLP